MSSDATMARASASRNVVTARRIVHTLRMRNHVVSETKMSLFTIGFMLLLLLFIVVFFYFLVASVVLLIAMGEVFTHVDPSLYLMQKFFFLNPVYWIVKISFEEIRKHQKK